MPDVSYRGIAHCYAPFFATQKKGQQYAVIRGCGDWGEGMKVEMEKVVPL